VIEYDHPFRRANDPDYTIPLCDLCHRRVTRMDNESGVDPAVPYAPFVFITHRMRLAFATHGFPAMADLLRSMENAVLNVNDAESRKYRRSRNRRNFAPVPDTDSTVLVGNLTSWAKRAAELAQMRLPIMQEPEAKADYEIFMRVLSEIMSEPTAFCDWIIGFANSPEGQVTASQALAFFAAAAIKAADVPELMKIWRDFASVILEEVNRS
jgi:hypothetical protein